MLCAMCISIFQTDPGSNTFPTVRGRHHASIADVEAAAQQGCYLCSELILDFEHEEVPEDDPLASSLSFDLRLHVISSPNGRSGVLSFESADDRLASAGYELVYSKHLQKPEGYDSFINNARADISTEPWRVRNDRFSSSQAAVPESTGDPKVLEIAEG